MSGCANCGKEILEPNVNYQISPDAICHCCIHDRRIAPENQRATDHFYLDAYRRFMIPWRIWQERIS